MSPFRPYRRVANDTLVKVATVNAGEDLATAVADIVAGIELTGHEVVSISHTAVTGSTYSVLVAYHKPND